LVYLLYLSLFIIIILWVYLLNKCIHSGVYVLAFCAMTVSSGKPALATPYPKCSDSPEENPYWAFTALGPEREANQLQWVLLPPFDRPKVVPMRHGLTTGGPGDLRSAGYRIIGGLGVCRENAVDSQRGAPIKKKKLSLNNNNKNSPLM
jgi:hypothetical protein